MHFKERIIMKIKSLLPLFLCFSLTAHAKSGNTLRPGDDIWIDIKILYAGVASAQNGIKQLGDTISSLQELTRKS